MPEDAGDGQGGFETDSGRILLREREERVDAGYAGHGKGAGRACRAAGERRKVTGERDMVLERMEPV